MNNLPPSYTDPQLRTFDVVQRNRMAWIVLIFILVVIAGTLIGVAYSAYTGHGSAWINIGILLLDGLLGWCLKQVVSYLFPPICRDNEGTVRHRR